MWGMNILYVKIKRFVSALVVQMVRWWSPNRYAAGWWRFESRCEQLFTKTLHSKCFQICRSVWARYGDTGASGRKQVNAALSGFFVGKTIKFVASSTIFLPMSDDKQTLGHLGEDKPTSIKLVLCLKKKKTFIIIVLFWILPPPNVAHPMIYR